MLQVDQDVPQLAILPVDVNLSTPDDTTVEVKQNIDSAPPKLVSSASEGL